MLRPSFTTAYALPRGNLRDKTRHRLGDLMLCSFKAQECINPIEPPEKNEFLVYDVVLKMCGFFERPEGYLDDQITGLVSSHFGSTSVKIQEGIWVA